MVHGTTFVVDNAPYHFVQLNKATSCNMKEHIKWSTENSIPHETFHTKPEFLQLISTRENLCAMKLPNILTLKDTW